MVKPEREEVAMPPLWAELAQEAVVHMTARLEELGQGQFGLGREMFVELADHEDCEEAYKALSRVTVGMENLAVILVRRLAQAMGKQPEAVVQDIAEFLAHQ